MAFQRKSPPGRHLPRHSDVREDERFHVRSFCYQPPKTLRCSATSLIFMVELPDLKGLGSAVNDLVKPLNEFQEIVAKAVVKPAGTAEHTAILRKAKEVGELVDKLADFTEKSLPQIKRIGKTENLERRVKDARGYFDKVKPAASN
eukprot:1373837-Amorphochlora_amoeboformis.AAC.1